MATKTKLTFEEWLREVDRAVSARTGLGRNDLPDCCYADWYTAGVTPRSAASSAIKAAKE